MDVLNGTATAIKRMMLSRKQRTIKPVNASCSLKCDCSLIGKTTALQAEVMGSLPLVALGMVRFHLVSRLLVRRDTGSTPVATTVMNKTMHGELVEVVAVGCGTNAQLD